MPVDPARRILGRAPASGSSPPLRSGAGSASTRRALHVPMALCQHRMMAEASAQFGRRDTDADPMSADHERLLDRLTDRFGNMITAAVQPLHESQRDTNREIGNIKGTLGEVKGKVDMLVAEREPEDDKTGTATVAMRAIGAVESKPWLMIGFVTMFAIASAAWVLTR